MKKKNMRLSLLVLISLSLQSFAQNVGIGTATPHSSALVEISSTTRGLLIPRVGLTSVVDASTISSPATSLLVFNTGTGGLLPSGYYFNAGTPASPNWVSLSNGFAWQLTGNSGTNPLNNFLGTTDNTDLVFRTNNTEKMRVTSSGNIGIGLTVPTLNITGRVLHLHNPSTNASAIHITNQTDGSNPDDGFVIGRWPDGWYGNGYILWNYENTPIRFATSSIERVSITGGGDVGIGTMSPNARLEIFSSLPTATTEPHLRIFNPTNSSGATSGLRLSTPGWNIKIQTVQNVDWLQITDATGSVQHAFFGRRFYPGSTSNNNTNTGYILGDGTNIGICTTTPLVPLDVRKQTGHAFGTGVNSNAPTTVIITGSNSAFHNDWPNGWGGGLSVWDICGASTYMTQYLTRSDSRFKTNIQTINPIDIFDKFMNLNPVSYYLNPKEIKANEIDYKRLRFGFLADQVEKLFPNIVVNAKTDNTIHRGIEYDSFIPLLVRVVQEQQKTIEEQKNRIERIEKELKKR